MDFLRPEVSVGTLARIAALTSFISLLIAFRMGLRHTFGSKRPNLSESALAPITSKLTPPLAIAIVIEGFGYDGRPLATCALFGHLYGVP